YDNTILGALMNAKARLEASSTGNPYVKIHLGPQEELKVVWIQSLPARGLGTAEVIIEGFGKNYVKAAVALTAITLVEMEPEELVHPLSSHRVAKDLALEIAAEVPGNASNAQIISRLIGLYKPFTTREDWRISYSNTFWPAGKLAA